MEFLKKDGSRILGLLKVRMNGIFHKLVKTGCVQQEWIEDGTHGNHQVYGVTAIITTRDSIPNGRETGR